MPHADLAFDAQPPYPKASDEDEFSSEGKSLKDIRGSSDPGIKPYVCLVANS
jgi:hypothetical protein